jgi:hypothetical protein
VCIYSYEGDVMSKYRPKTPIRDSYQKYRETKDDYESIWLTSIDFGISISEVKSIVEVKPNIKRLIKDSYMRYRFKNGVYDSIRLTAIDYNKSITEIKQVLGFD